MVHMGGAAIPTLDRSAIETAQQYPNITLVGSSINELAILRAIQALGPERICFGSDTPFGLMHVRLAMLKALMRDFSQADQSKVFSENISRFVGI